MVLRKECAVCHKKYFRGLNDNFVYRYNSAVVRLSLSSVVAEDQFVCEHCAEKAVATKVKKECAVCHKEYMMSLSDNFADWWLSDVDFADLDWYGGVVIHSKLLSPHMDHGKTPVDVDVRDKGLLIEFLKSTGLVQDAERVSKSIDWVCDDCYCGLAEKAIKQNGDCSARDLFLHAPIVHKSGHCSRCGQQIQHDFSPLVLRFYKRMGVPLTARTFLVGELCHKCTPFLLPEKVNQYVQYMLNGGWRGEMSTILYQSTFPCKITICGSAAASLGCGNGTLLKNALRDKAISLGANALIDFHYERGSSGWYSGSATPIRLDPVQTKHLESDHTSYDTRQRKEDAVVVQKGTLICIDGSNVIREDATLRAKTLSAMIEALKQNGYPVRTFVDKSIFNWLRKDMNDEAGIEYLRRGEEEGIVMVVPSKAEADGQILQFAEYERDAHIISNDRYRDYVKLHPWLTDGKSRVHGFNLVHRGNGSVRVLIAGFNLDITVS